MKNFDPRQCLRETTRLLIRDLEFLDRSEAVCYGITLTQGHIIIEIGSRKQVSVNELSELLSLDKSTVSRTVAKLVNNDILVRQPDLSDRRCVVLQLTGKGESLFGNIKQRMEEYFTEIIETIPKAEREQVIESLQLFAKAIHNKRCC